MPVSCHTTLSLTTAQLSRASTLTTQIAENKSMLRRFDDPKWKNEDYLITVQQHDPNTFSHFPIWSARLTKDSLRTIIQRNLDDAYLELANMGITITESA